MKEKLLFICNANLQRSPTAEELFREKGYETKSVGIHPLAETQISQQALDWANKIYVMEEFQKQFLLKNFNISENKIMNLNISDIYERNSPELKKILEDKIKNY